MKLGFLTVLVSFVFGASGVVAQECEPPRILLTIDKSYSMTYAISGDDNKWVAAKKAISKVAADHHEAAAFGVQVFPRAPRTCDSGQITLPIGEHNQATIMDALGADPVSGNNTPIAETLSALLEEDALLDDGADRHVILVTDGWQYCGEPHDYRTRYNAVGVVEELKKRGVTVHVVGFGDGVDPLLLNRTAMVAETAVAGCDPTLEEPMASGHCYLVASDAQGIKDVLTSVTNRITQETCDGFDNDCDGAFDEDYDQDGDSWSTCGTRSGESTTPSDALVDCNDNDPAINVEAEEICDNIDNDCDGMIDNGCECEVGSQQACGSSEGACAEGRQFCGTQGWGDECIDEVGPSDEICDNIDNDCDAQLDEEAECGEGEICWEGECQSAGHVEGGAGCGCGVGVKPNQVFGWALLAIGVILTVNRRRRCK